MSILYFVIYRIVYQQTFFIQRWYQYDCIDLESSLTAIKFPQKYNLSLQRRNIFRCHDSDMFARVFVYYSGRRLQPARQGAWPVV